MIETSLHQSEPVVLPGRPFGRQVRSVAGYALLTALMIVTPMIVFVPAALLHCAIRNGARAAWAVVALALGLAVLYVTAVPSASPDAANMTWSYLAAVGIAVTVPTMIVIPMVERGEKLGRVLVFLLIGAAAGLGITEVASRELLSFSPYAAQVAQAKAMGSQFLESYRASAPQREMDSFAERWVSFSSSAYVMPALILINVALVFILSLLMLGRLKAWREHAGQRGEEAAGAYLFRNFALPDWMLFAFILGGLTPLASGLAQQIASNTLVVVVFLYILQGLAIFRYLLLAIGAGLMGTLLAWSLLAFLTITGVGPLLLGIAGLFDSFFDFRHPKKRKDDSDESHSD